MCFSDPIDNHGVPQASWLLYLADQRPRQRKNYGKGGKYGTQVRATGGGWRGRNDPRYTPAPPAEHTGDPGDGGDGLVYPPAPRQSRGGGGGRVRVPPGVNAGRGNGGASVASGGSQGGRGRRGPAPRGGQGEEPAAPVVRDFGAEGDAGTQVGGMGFDAHTVRTATVLSNSSSGVGSGAGAGAGRSRAGTGMGGRERGGGGDDGMLHVSSRPMFSSFGSGDWNVDDILLQNMISKVDQLFHRHPA